MKIGCGTVTFRQYPLEEALASIRRAGYEYIEPQATPPFCPHIDVDMDHPGEFRQMIEKHGFRGATALWSTHGAIIPDGKSVEYAKKCLRWAKEAGIPVVNIGDGFKPKEMSEHEAWAVLRERLLEILSVAEECEVFLAIEPHGTFSLTAEGLMRTMALSDSPWLGINYDTANVHRAAYVESTGDRSAWRSTNAKEDEVDVLRQVVDHVVHVHVKDVRGRQCVTLGAGDVDVVGCLKVLHEHGYRGVLSLETEGDFSIEDGEVIIRDSRQFLLQALAALEQQA
ncbi:MAG: sugar phosphate isomerase/epimerase family protein [Limnochordia bacterium]